MEKFSGAEFYNIARTLEYTVQGLLRRSEKQPEAEVVSDDEARQIADNLTNIKGSCIKIGLNLAAEHISEVYGHLTDLEYQLAPKYLSNLLDQVSDSIRREMSGALFLYISAEKAKWYNSPLQGWDTALERFGDKITNDVEEAGKSFACGRNAAAVFHMMLVAEFGALEVGDLIGMKDPKPSWHGVMNQVRRITQDTKYTNLTPAEQKYFKFLEQLSPLMLATQNAWRHKIDHAANRLVLATGEFQPYVAEDIMLTTRAFMRSLASELKALEQ